MKIKSLLILSLFALTCLFTSIAAAQTGGNYTITQSVIAGGGGNSSGGNYAVTGTVGQAAAGTVSNGGGFSVAGGFWSAAPLGTITISGTVTLNGNPLQGVAIALSGTATGNTTTDVNGNYQFTNLLAGQSYTVTPSLAGYVFNPPSANFTVPQTDSDINQNFTATQCTYSLTPPSVNVGAAAASGSFTVTAPAGCPWTAAPADSWLTITPPASGSGNGTVNYNIGANSNAARVGTINVAGQTFTVNQALGHSISGTVAYGTNNSKFVPGVTLSAVGPNTVVTTSLFSPAGNYTLAGLTDGASYTVTPIKATHVNGITPFDATLILRHVAAGGTGPNALSANQQTAADGDGIAGVTSFDATLILRYVAAGGPNANTGQNGTWKFVPTSRPYPNLVSNPTGENYTAFLIGDVDGDWSQPSSLADDGGWEKLAAESFDYSSEKVDDDVTNIRVSLSENLAPTKSSVVLVPVLLSNKTGRDVSSFAIDVAFDPAVLQIDEDKPIELTGTIAEGGNFAIVSDAGTPGKIGIAGGGGSLFYNPSGTLVNLRFKVVGSRGVSKRGTTLNVTRALFQDQDGIQIAARGSKQ